MTESTNFNDLFYNVDIYSSEFMFTWEKLYNNISPKKIPFYIINKNGLLDIIVNFFNHVISSIESAHNVFINKDDKGYMLCIIKDYYKYLISSYNNENISDNKPFKELFPDNYFSKLISGYEPNRSFFYIAKYEYNENIDINIKELLVDTKFIVIVLPILTRNKLGFCGFTLPFNIEDLNNYIDNIDINMLNF